MLCSCTGSLYSNKAPVVAIILETKVFNVVFFCVLTVQKLQDHLPALCWSVLLYLCGRD